MNIRDYKLGMIMDQMRRLSTSILFLTLVGHSACLQAQNLYDSVVRESYDLGKDNSYPTEYYKREYTHKDTCAIHIKQDFTHSFAVKTNILMDLGTAFNLEIEYVLGKHVSFSIPVYYNPFTISRKFTLRTLAVQPELRIWTKRAMNGHFFGLHAIGGYYNFYCWNNIRYQDRDGETPCYGGGLSYGYSFRLSKQWNLELTAGAGVVRLDYDRFDNYLNGKLIDNNKTWYVGPTKVGITFTWILNGK